MIKATFSTGKDALECIACLAVKKSKRSLYKRKVEINDRSRCPQPVRQGSTQPTTSITTGTCDEAIPPPEAETNIYQQQHGRRAEDIRVPEMTKWQKFQVILPFVGIVAVMAVATAVCILIVI